MLLFAYFGDFSLRVRSFDHISTAGSKSDIIFEFSTPVFLQRRGHFWRAPPFLATFVAILSARARKCINSTSGPTVVAGNDFVFVGKRVR